VFIVGVLCKVASKVKREREEQRDRGKEN